MLRSDGTENSLKDSRLPRPNLTGARLLREFSVPLFLTKLVLNCVINDCILELTALDLALPPAKRFSAFVVSSKEGFNGLAQLIFVFEASSVECLALQQAEYDFNLVQPTGRSRREMKLDSAPGQTAQR